MKFENLGQLVKRLETRLTNFHGFADDPGAYAAWEVASQAYEAGKLALMTDVDTEYAHLQVIRALETLDAYTYNL